MTTIHIGNSSPLWFDNSTGSLSVIHWDCHSPYWKAGSNRKITVQFRMSAYNVGGAESFNATGTMLLSVSPVRFHISAQVPEAFVGLA